PSEASRGCCKEERSAEFASHSSPAPKPGVFGSTFKGLSWDAKASTLRPSCVPHASPLRPGPQLSRCCNPLILCAGDSCCSLTWDAWDDGDANAQRSAKLDVMVMMRASPWRVGHSVATPICRNAGPAFFRRPDKCARVARPAFAE